MDEASGVMVVGASAIAIDLGMMAMFDASIQIWFITIGMLGAGILLIGLILKWGQSRVKE